MSVKIKHGPYDVEVFWNDDEAGCDKPRIPLIWIHCFPGEAAEIWEKSQKGFALAAVTGIDWNQDLSPWKAEKAFAKGEDFGGGAQRYLEIFSTEIVPAVEEKLPFSICDRGIAGYSMAGLFAIYAMYHSNLFNRIGSMSGSLWFDGWLDYAQNNVPMAENPKIYISLGGKEHRVGEPRMARVREATDMLVSHWKKGYSVCYEINAGGHFTDIPGRMARGLDKLSVM